MSLSRLPTSSVWTLGIVNEEVEENFRIIQTRTVGDFQAHSQTRKPKLLLLLQV